MLALTHLNFTHKLFRYDENTEFDLQSEGLESVEIIEMLEVWFGDRLNWNENVKQIKLR